MGNKVRIYDLAKELKLESKKVLDDARMMGVDVSVPSNSVDDVIAARIREKYYPKKEQATATHRARLIKHPPASSAPAGSPGLGEAETRSELVAEAEPSGAQPAAPPPPAESAPSAPAAPEPATRVVVLKPIVPPVAAP
ncbi:MAG: hypothetical protein RIR86_2387, partial [Acidobacteriota bacterium]